jgi:hypothetical protein
MPLARTYSFAALDMLDNPDYAPISSVSCHSQMPVGSLPCNTVPYVPSESSLTTVGKPFVKPPTIPFNRMSFIRKSSPLAPSHNFPTLSMLPPPKPPTIPFNRMSFIRKSSPLAPSHNFPTLSMLPPPKQLTSLKPKSNLYRKTLIFYWGRRNFAYREFSKKYVTQGRISKKRTSKKYGTMVVNLPVEQMRFEKAAVKIL